MTIALGVNYTAPGGGAVTVTSSIGTATSQGPNTLPDTGSATTTVSALADVTVTITVPPTATAGTVVNGTVGFGNSGASSAANVTYGLALPPGLVGVSFSGLPGGATASYDAASGAVSFSGLPVTLAPGASIPFGVTYTAPGSGSVSVNGSIGTSTNQGANVQPDSASATTAISTLADVTTAVTMPATAVAASPVNGSVSFSNNGPSPATGVTYALGLTPGLIGVSFSGVPGGATATYDPATGGVTLTGMPGTLAAGASIVLGVSYTAPASGSVAATSTIGTATSQGPNTLPDTATGTTAISPLADVTTTVVLPALAVAASTVNGTVTYGNAGPSTATGMTYALGLPPGLSGVGFTGLPVGATATYDPASGAVNFTGMPASLTAGATLTLGLSFTAPASGSVAANTSIGTSTNQGPNTRPDTASGTTAISPRADVTTVVSVPPTAQAASAVSGTVTYTNTGPSTAAGMTYLLGLAPGLAGVSFTGLPGGASATYDAGSGAVTLSGMPASLGAGTSLTVGVNYTAPPSGSVQVMSSVGTSTSQGPNTQPDSANGTTAISPLADVTTTISVPATAVAGSVVNGTVTYSNHGPSTAAGLSYLLGLPPGLAGVTFSGLPGGATASYDGASGGVTFTGMPTSLGANASITVGLSYTAPGSGSVGVASEIGTSTSQGPNTLPDTTMATTAISPLADVTTSVSVPPSAIAGSTVNASVTYTNHGPSLAAGLVFTMGLPPGLANVTVNGLPAGVTATYDPATGAISFAGAPTSAGAGSSITLGVSYTAPASGAVTLGSSVSTTTSQGPNTLPDTASATTSISPLADVTTTVSVPPSAVAGSTVNGSVTYGNNGPSTATGVTYTLGLPPGLTNVVLSGVPAGATATYDLATGAVNFSGMPTSAGAGSSVVLGVSFTAPPSGVVVIDSGISTATSQGANTLPDTTTATTAISPLADVTTSVSVPPSAVAGSTVNGSVTYSNSGPSSAAGLVFTLGLPPGLTNVVLSGVPAGATATYDPATGAVNFSGMPTSGGAGSSIVLGVSFTAPGSGSVTIDSSIGTTTSQGTNARPDTATAATAISPLADVTTSVSAPPSAVAGSTVNGTVTYSNQGPSPAAGLVFSLGLAPALTNVVLSGLPAGVTATYDPATEQSTSPARRLAWGPGRASRWA